MLAAELEAVYIYYYYYCHLENYYLAIFKKFHFTLANILVNVFFFS